MTLPASGAITLTMVAAELSIALPLQLGDSRVRALAVKPSGEISLGDLRGKSAYTPPTITSATTATGHQYAENGDMVVADATCVFTIHNGEAPFTWSWSRVSGAAAISAITLDGKPWFSASAVAPWAYSATYRATITDARSNQAVSSGIVVTLSANNT